MYKVCIVADTYMNTLQLFCDCKSFFSNAIELQICIWAHVKK